MTRIPGLGNNNMEILNVLFGRLSTMVVMVTRLANVVTRLVHYRAIGASRGIGYDL